jgi:hypothetical protein
MSKQATLIRNAETGRIEMAAANQPYNYNEDLSEQSLSEDDAENKKLVIYMTTNMLSPSNQPINEIIVDTLSEDQIHDYLKNYYAKLPRGKDHYRVFDPKENLLPFKNKALPTTLLSPSEVRDSAEIALGLH